MRITQTLHSTGYPYRTLALDSDAQLWHSVRIIDLGREKKSPFSRRGYTSLPGEASFYIHPTSEPIARLVRIADTHLMEPQRLRSIIERSLASYRAEICNRLASPPQEEVHFSHSTIRTLFGPQAAKKGALFSNGTALVRLITEYGLPLWHIASHATTALDGESHTFTILSTGAEVNIATSLCAELATNHPFREAPDSKLLGISFPARHLTDTSLLGRAFHMRGAPHLALLYDKEEKAWHITRRIDTTPAGPSPRGRWLYIDDGSEAASLIAPYEEKIGTKHTSEEIDHILKASYRSYSKSIATVLFGDGHPDQHGTLYDRALQIPHECALVLFGLGEEAACEGLFHKERAYVKRGDVWHAATMTNQSEGLITFQLMSTEESIILSSEVLQPFSESRKQLVSFDPPYSIPSGHLPEAFVTHS